MIVRRPPLASLSISVATLALVLISLSSSASAQTPPPAWTAPPPNAAPPPAPPPPPFPPSLQAGGLTPPPSTMPPAQPALDPNQTEKDLDKARKEDSKRGLEWFWINAEGGFSYVDMRTFVVDDKDFTFGFVPTKALGGTVGAGLGVRFLFLTLGARGRLGLFDPWQLFTVGGELGIHLPLGRVEPHFELGGGYAAIGNVSGLVKGSSDAISISGAYGRASLGVDVFVTPLFSVGVLGSADLLALVRPRLNDTQIQAIQNDPNISALQKSAATGFGTEGSSLGLAGGVTAVLGLHF